MPVEHAFGRLKSRFRCLLKRLDVNVENANNIIIACCVLHNLCIVVGDRPQREWARQLRHAIIPEQPEDERDEEDNEPATIANAEDIRRLISFHFI